MSYIKFNGRWSERDLIEAILSSSQASILGRNFPRVSVIGRRTKIHPDIDILKIKDEKLIGFEVKIIKFKEREGWNWEEVYKGIGEALLYLQFGLDQCGLILGFHQDVADEKIDEFCKELRKKKSILSQILGRYFNFGIFLWEGGGIEEITKAEGDFCYSSYQNKFYGKEIEKQRKILRNNLLNKEFLWDKRLAQECKYAEKW